MKLDIACRQEVQSCCVNDRGVRSVVTVGDRVSLLIRHEERGGALSAAERSGLSIEAPDENDTLTEVEVRGEPEPVTVRVHWRRLGDLEFHLLYVPEKHVLFLGAGGVAAAVACAPPEIVALDHPILFWHYERIGSHVVAFGETECLLHRLDGRVVQRALVDPPYEVIRSASGLEFQSIVTGTTSLRFES